MACTWSPLELRDRQLGEGPAELLGGPGVAAHRRPQPVVSTLGAGPATRAARPHHRQPGGAVGPARASGPRHCGAAGRGPAPLAGQARGVAAARRLHQHRSLLEAGPDRLEGGGGDARTAGEGVPGQLLLGGAGHPHGDPRRQPCRGRVRSRRPSRCGAGTPPRRCGANPTTKRPAPCCSARSSSDLAGVGVGRPRLGVQVVPVVPDDHQPEVAHGRERRRAGADGDPPGTAAERQEVAVARAGPTVGGEHDVLALPQETVDQRAVDPLGVPVVRGAHDGTPTRGVRRGHRGGQHRRPVGAGRHRAHRPR